MEKIRTCQFAPYKPGQGPRFTLTVWDTGRTDRDGKHRLAYRLTQTAVNGQRTVLFRGDDFHCSPMHAIDSDAAMKALMAFLTLKPGDTDAEYFSSYTPEQLAYCDAHAEALDCEVSYRFSAE